MQSRTALATHAVRDFRLGSGEILPELVTAYATRGTLSAARDNAVLLLHGYTTGPGMLDAGAGTAEGSWYDLVGPGRAIDTDRWFVICPNALGSSYGSTGPGSIDPRSGRPWGAAFPRIVMQDIVAAQCVLIDALGIDRLAAVIGPSLGAMQAFAWGVYHPERVARVVATVGAPFRPDGVVSADAVMAQLQADPGWHDGHYADHPGSMIPFLVRARIATLQQYGIEADLRERFPDDAARSAEIERLAVEWARDFDAGSLLTLARAIEHFDLRGELYRLSAPLLYVLSASDPLFPPSLLGRLSPWFDAAGLRWSFVRLDSDKGHLASGADAALWAPQLRHFLETPPGQWTAWGAGAG